MITYYIIAFLILMLTIGIVTSQKIKTFDDFALSRNKFPSFSLIATITASLVGGGTIIGNAEQSFSFGIAYLLPFTIGFCFQILLIGIFFASKIQQLKNVVSVGDIIRSVYGRSAQIIMGVMWMVFCIGIIILNLVALTKILQMWLPWSYFLVLVVAGSIVALYCILGGIRSVVITDIIQCVVMFISIPVVFYIAIIELGGFDSTIKSIPSSYFNPLYYLGFEEIVVIFLSLVLGDLLIPPVVQRLLMSSSAKQARLTMIFSSISILFICFIGGSLGMLAYALNPSIEPVKAIPFLFDKLLSNMLIKVLFACGLISVIMSSVDTYLNSLSIVFVNDILAPITNIGDRTKLYVARMVSLSAIIVAIFLAIETGNILSILLNAYRFWGPTMLIPLIGILLKKTVSKKGFYICFATGMIVNVIWDLLKLEEILKMNSLIPAILVNFCTYTLIYVNERATSHNYIKDLQKSSTV